GHAVADGVDDAEADALFVEAGDVVQVAADVSARAEEHVEVHSADLRKLLGQEILLEAGGEAQFLVEAQHVEFQRLVAAAEEVDLVLEVIDFGLKRGESRLGGLKGIERLAERRGGGGSWLRYWRVG